MAKEILVKSTSGVRGVVGQGLDPALALSYGAALGKILGKGRIVVGRDSRPSGPMLSRAVTAGLTAVGRNVVDIGMVPTPTVEIAIKKLRAAGGICITASHNPAQWNALKFFNNRGEFITPAEYKKLNKAFERGRFDWVSAQDVGVVDHHDHWIDEHIKLALQVKGVARRAIRNRKYKVVVDAINGAGSSALPRLLNKLGCTVVGINCNGDGKFTHEPEPVAKNLRALSRAVRKHGADIGLACDPDADRLAIVSEKGRPVGEELTLAIAIQPVLMLRKGPVVINLSTSKATADMAESMGASVYYSKVGESNVVETMRGKRAVIGGEGNGGVIYPAFHAGRDSLIAAALVLSALARKRLSVSELVETLPKYYTVKAKAALKAGFDRQLKDFEKDAPKILGKVKIDRRDGRRFDFERGWVQIRTSNTEPIFRLIVETDDKKLTGEMVDLVRRYFT
jgi:phosphomannomutase